MSALAATYKVTLAYGGNRLRGVSPQPGQPTVASELTTALTTAFSQPPVALAWAARTDAGVHALANVFSFRLRQPVTREELADALAASLSPDLRVRGVEVVPRSFHARAQARAKLYRYRMTWGAESPSLVGRCWHVDVPLDLRAMRMLAAWLPGTRDWSALRHPRCSANNPVKTVDSVVVRGRRVGHTQLVQVDVRGDAFLRQMVRRLAGTLASVGSGWLGVEDAQAAILALRREDAGPCAPAHGLTLMRVEY